MHRIPRLSIRTEDRRSQTLIPSRRPPPRWSVPLAGAQRREQTHLGTRSPTCSLGPVLYHRYRNGTPHFGLRAAVTAEVVEAAEIAGPIHRLRRIWHFPSEQRYISGNSYSDTL